MPRSKRNGEARRRVTRGGYEAGPKKVSELKPPPNTVGAGVKVREPSLPKK
jgi:hypothetical protein